MANDQRLSDADMLTALDLIEAQGLSRQEVAERYGMTRSAMCGMIFRINRELAASEAAPGPKAVKPSNQDGALGRLWWKAGAAAQDEAPLYPKRAPDIAKPSRWGQRRGAIDFRKRA